jgi:hypothetical protein
MIHTLAREREDEIREELLREESLLERRSLSAQQPKLQRQWQRRWSWQLAIVVRHIGSHIATLSLSRARD